MPPPNREKVPEATRSREGRPGHEVCVESREALGDQNEILDAREWEMLEEERRKVEFISASFVLRTPEVKLDPCNQSWLRGQHGQASMLPRPCLFQS